MNSGSKKKYNISGIGDNVKLVPVESKGELNSFIKEWTKNKAELTQKIDNNASFQTGILDDYEKLNKPQLDLLKDLEKETKELQSEVKKIPEAGLNKSLLGRNDNIKVFEHVSGRIGDMGEFYNDLQKLGVKFGVSTDDIFRSLVFLADEDNLSYKKMLKKLKKGDIDDIGKRIQQIKSSLKIKLLDDINDLHKESRVTWEE